MKCKVCGRKLINQKSILLGCGPVCYGKVYGQPNRKRVLKVVKPIDSITNYDIPGQISLDEYLQSIT